MSETSPGDLPKRPLPALSLAALGIVFGDIGTSPLYTFKTVLDLTGANPDAGPILGSASLLLCTVIAIMGLSGVVQQPSIGAALNPVSGLRSLECGGLVGFLVLGGVSLCVTGAEALEADVGDFGPAPIRLAWNFVVLPSLVLNYAG